MNPRDRHIGVVRKDRRNEVHVSVRDFPQGQLVDLRLFSFNGREMAQTPKGFALPVSVIDDLIGLLTEARRVASSSSPATRPLIGREVRDAGGSR